jgi:methyl-accepting chemotaxis protein
LGFACVSLVAGAGLEPLIQWQFQSPDASAADAAATLESALIWGGAGLLASLGLGVAWGAGVAGPILRAIHRLEAEADGGETGEIAKVEASGCAGRIARATVALRTLRGAKQLAEQDAAEKQNLLAAARQQSDAQATQYSTQQRQVLQALGNCLEQLASGDLSARLNAALPPDYEHLRPAFNDVINGLHGSLAAVAERVGALLAGAEEMSSTAQDMARRTEQQAVTLKQTTSALSEITETVRKSTASAEQANTVISTARADAEKSGQVMAQATTAMTQIEQSASQISQIIGVIDEIAFQTNLLALNAGVEAARAGEAGRGFAVVASEVRGLAQRSAEAAKEIKTLITTSSQQVKSGVSLVAQAGDGLHRIVTQVGSLNELIAGLTESSKAQARGLHEVNSVVGQMDQATQQSAAMVQSSSTSGATLTQEARALAQEVGARLGEDVLRRSQPAAPRPTLAAKRPSVSQASVGTVPAGKVPAGKVPAGKVPVGKPGRPTIRSLLGPAAKAPTLGPAAKAPPRTERVAAPAPLKQSRMATARQTQPATEPDDWSEF